MHDMSVGNPTVIRASVAQVLLQVVRAAGLFAVTATHVLKGT